MYTRSPYHLTDDQIDFFDTNGYLVLRNHIPADMLKTLQSAGDEWIRQGLELQKSGGTLPEDEQADYRFAKRKGGKKVFFRVDYIHHKGRKASLEILGSPQVLAVAESLCGRNFVPSYESMVFKFAGDGEAVPWHQDAVFTRKNRVFNYDIYLDASLKEAGALHVIPGSHKKSQDICSMEETYGWDPPGSIVVEMQPGDVLLHDDMVVHGSPQASGNALRRTIYFEFRSVEQILDEGPWEMDFIKKRMQLIPLAQKLYKEHFPEKDRFEWRAENADRTKPETDEKKILRTLHMKHTPGSFCSATSE